MSPHVAALVAALAGLVLMFLGCYKMIYGHVNYCEGPNPWIRTSFAGCALFVVSSLGAWFL